MFKNRLKMATIVPVFNIMLYPQFMMWFSACFPTGYNMKDGQRMVKICITIQMKCLPIQHILNNENAF